MKTGKNWGKEIIGTSNHNTHTIHQFERLYRFRLLKIWRISSVAGHHRMNETVLGFFSDVAIRQSDCEIGSKAVEVTRCQFRRRYEFSDSVFGFETRPPTF